ncbi:MAG: YIEGIA domain-containing protein [Bacillota bacterium]|nr:YIEGIA domain-containing protein [Bacillota bacterium]
MTSVGSLGPYLPPILIGWIFGVAARLLVMQVDYRAYPSYPAGYTVHLGLGVIAALVGAVAIPALADKQFTAVTFLLLVATEFRQVRDMERKTLQGVDATELIPRGEAYIEGIARTFEARYFLVIGVSALVSTVTLVAGKGWGVVAGALALGGTLLLRQGRRLGDYCDVRESRITWDELGGLHVAGIYMLSVGLEQVRGEIDRWAVAVEVVPRGPAGQLILSDPGQRQAILHDVTHLFGYRFEVAEPEYVPMARKNLESGVLGIYLTPMRRDVPGILRAIRNVPVLERTRGGRRRQLPGGERR